MDSPVKGRKNWPFLFKEVGEPKKAFWTVIFSIESPVETDIVGQGSNPSTPKIPCPIYGTLSRVLKNFASNMI
ncbi:hypothetical protein AS030_06650 [Fictibacillus enclensis]|uniref:Uncharacterized protein n=1 Tax=Fictibacillus enclensis TaxID=1017270 RepID=A0A0V8JDH0_9BACL|nr:hypothetical protein AS030_06650 [Fictibacillus enclensis]